MTLLFGSDPTGAMTENPRATTQPDPNHFSLLIVISNATEAFRTAEGALAAGPTSRSRRCR
jgi:hypothetical protein